MRLSALRFPFFVAHDLGPKTGRHFSGSCAPEARHLDGLRKWPRRGRFVFLFVTKTRAQKTAPRERFSTSSLPAKGAKRRLRVK
jgi:hypothetical protein